MADNWISYEDQRPPEVLCEFLDMDGKRFTANPKDFHAMFNIGGMKWRLTGIGREELALNPRLRTRPIGAYMLVANSILMGSPMGAVPLSGFHRLGGDY